MVIDCVKLQEKYKIISKFQNIILNIDKFSTGCKTVLNVYYNPDVLFSITEFGDNAIDVIYTLQSDKIYSEYTIIAYEITTGMGIKSVQNRFFQVLPLLLL